MGKRSRRDAESECWGTCSCVLASASEMVEMKEKLGRRAREAIYPKY
jgi:hypothetical protein